MSSSKKKNKNPQVSPFEEVINNNNIKCGTISDQFLFMVCCADTCLHTPSIFQDSSLFLTLSFFICFLRHLHSLPLITVKCGAPRTTECTGREQQTTLSLSTLLHISLILHTLLPALLLDLRRMWVLLPF